MIRPPKISVLLPAYNAQAFVAKAIESILGQTFTDFEFLIFDDGSTDKTLDIIKGFAKKDDRIRIISRPNKGLVATLNEGLGLARGEFIARQDADDISLPERFESEIQYLEAHPNVGLVGSNYISINESGTKDVFVTNVFTHPEDLKMCLVLCNQFGHGSIMMRKSVVQKVEGVKGYDPAVGHVEDYDFFVRISRVTDVANIEKPLYKWRRVKTSVTHTNSESQIKSAFIVRDRAFLHFLKHRQEYNIFGYHPTGSEYRVRKSTMYRDFGYLAKKQNKNLLALLFILLAIFYQPNLKRNYKYLILVFYKPLEYRWRFDLL